MVSGQPGPGQPGPYPMYQPVYQPPKSTSETMKGLFLSDVALALAFGLGLLLWWIGSLIWGTTGDQDVYDIGMGVQSFGVLLIVAAMLLAGLVRHDMDKLVRFGLLLGGVLILIFVGFWTWAF